MLQFHKKRLKERSQSRWTSLQNQTLSVLVHRTLQKPTILKGYQLRSKAAEIASSTFQTALQRSATRAINRGKGRLVTQRQRAGSG